MPQRWGFLRWTFAVLLVSGAVVDNTVFAPAPQGSDDGIVDDWCGNGRMELQEQARERTERKREELERELEGLERELEGLERPRGEPENRIPMLLPECIENPLLPSCRSQDRRIDRRRAPKPGKPRLIFIANEPDRS